MEKDIPPLYNTIDPNSLHDNYVVPTIYPSERGMVYYWRDYFGNIPSDAVPVGRENDQIYYISQGIVQANSVTYGSVPAKLIPSQSTIYPCIGRPLAVNDGIKILCSPTPHAFRWLKTSRATFTEDLCGRKPVHGGLEARMKDSYRSVLYIGRHENCIGKIVAEEHVMYYAPNTTVAEEKCIANYEILVH